MANVRSNSSNPHHHRCLPNPQQCSHTLRLERESTSLTLFQKPSPEDPESSQSLHVGELYNDHKIDNHHLKSIPYKIFKFKNWNLDHSLAGLHSKEIDEYFWEEIGPQIEIVHFESCSSSHLACNEFQSMIFYRMTNLKAIKMSSGKFAVPKNSKEKCKWGAEIHSQLECMRHPLEKVKKLVLSGMTPLEFGRLLGKIFPNLESLGMDSTGVGQNEAEILYGTWWASLPSNIKHLSVMLTGFKEKHTEIESRYLVHYLSALKLETLAIQIPPSETFSEDNFRKLLEAERGTLRKLSLFRKPFLPPFSEFPFAVEMESLEELHLFGNVAGDFRFLKNTPKLKKLYLSRTCFELWENMKPVSKVIKPYDEDMAQKADVNCNMSQVGLEFMEAFHFDFRFPPESLRKLKMWLPNLKSLEVIVGNEELGVICEAWRGLEELQLLYGSDVDDQAICGGLPYLTNLKKFSFFGKCGGGRLTDLSVQEGFLRLPVLEKLNISVSAQMTQTAKNLLKERIPSVNIFRNYLDPHKGECCRRKQFEEETFAPPPMEIDDELMTKSLITLICGVYADQQRNEQQRQTLNDEDTSSSN